ncbi:unnamed protein product [Pseudo-nitzschia multistriata]|uniref:Cytochrome P450 n=1 Tax=Pseudo-nitzschia multistriata TaxID=183589 RepID=A0A448ZAU7_9STRA|nr:unnamed protein product [Pseudo-nitzschia multistriata]
MSPSTISMTSSSLSPTIVTFLLLGLLAALPAANAFQTAEKTVSTPLTNKKKDIRLAEIPTPVQWPLIGNLPDFLSRGGVDGYAEVHESMYRDYGEVYGSNLGGGNTMLVVADPNVYDQVLRREGTLPRGGAEMVTTFTDYYKENELELPLKSISAGPGWREWRSALNPDLYVLWDTYLPAIAKSCSEISSVAGTEMSRKNLSFHTFVSRAAFDMFSAVLFGESPRTTDTSNARPEDVEFVKATQTAFEATGKLMTNPMEKYSWFPSEGDNLYEIFVKNMDLVFNIGKDRCTKFANDALSLQQEAAKAKESEANGSGIGSETGSLASEASNGCPVTALKSTIQSAKPRMSLGRNKVVPTSFGETNPSLIERLVDRGVFGDENDETATKRIDTIGDVAAPLLMAGVDTTAYVMGWFYLNLASNPDVQTRLAIELRETLGGADVVTVEQLESLTYLKACFRESHRLTPSNPLLTKKLKEDIDLVVTNGNNGSPDKAYRAPAGENICLNLRGIPMDPKYVENPMVFSPERFLPEAVSARKGTPSEVIDHPYFSDPFGRGKRRCIGANVAVAEMLVLAARLVQDWEIRLVDPSEATTSPTKKWKPKQKLMLLADPYPDMVLVPRTKA